MSDPGLRPRRGIPELEDGYKRRLPVGAEVLPGGKAHFRVWAPKRQRLEVVFSRALI